MMLKYLLKHRMAFAGALVMLFLVDAIQLAIPLVIRSAIDGLRSHPSPESIATAGLTIVGIGVAMFGLRAAWRALLMFTAYRIVTDLRESLFQRLLRFSQKFYGKWETGDLMARATNDLSAVRSLFSFGVISIFDMIVLGAAALSFMMYLSMPLTLVAVLPLPLLAVAVFYFESRIHRTFQLVQAKYSDLTGFVQEAFSGVFVLKAFHREKAERDRFEVKNREFIRHQMDLAHLNAFFDPSMNFIIALSNVLVLYVGGRAVMARSMTLGDLVGFLAYLDTLAWPVMALGFSVTIYQRGKASLGRIEAITEAPADQHAHGEPPFDAPGGVAVEARSLRFSYEGGSPVLRDLSFSIPAGKCLGILGRVGSGKSTLVKLLTGLLDSPPGGLFLNGRDLHSIPLDSLRKVVSCVPQEAFLFSLTVRENIAFHSPEASQESVRHAAWTADMEESIAQMKEGDSTLVGERGVTLSGGQKQRLTLARALMKPGGFLILDDCFSSIDSETEDRILERLRSQLNGQTVLLITHRISTLRFADEILFLDEGEVVERGSHQELLARGGRYAALYEKQVLSEKLAKE